MDWPVNRKRNDVHGQIERHHRSEIRVGARLDGDEGASGVSPEGIEEGLLTDKRQRVRELRLEPYKGGRWVGKRREISGGSEQGASE